MTREPAQFNNWQTVRYELLNTRICDLGLRVEGSRLEPFIRQLQRELEAKKLEFRPPVYLTDGWGCPDRVPVIGVPFYLADERLARIEEEQTGEVEDYRTTMMFLRHESAHAFNYAYRFFERPEWDEVFGRFDKPYREIFKPESTSRDFVRHLTTAAYGRTYAQKHPDEDFAETFAVWLTPRSGWKRKYRLWPALEKLKCVDSWMRSVRHLSHPRVTGRLVNPVQALEMLLAEHYGARAEAYRAAAQGYVDDRLREVFRVPAGGRTTALSKLIAKHRGHILEAMSRWSGLEQTQVEAVLSKLEERSTALKIRIPVEGIEKAIMETAAMTTALAMDFAYTGQLLR